MSDNRSSAKKVYNYQTPFGIERRSWDTGVCKLVTIKGCTGFMLEPHKPAQRCTLLETNFFSTELMKVVPDNIEAVARFMGKYGLLDCPYRESSIPLSAIASLLPAVEQTNRVRECLQKDYIKESTAAVLDGQEDFLPISPDSSVILPHHFVSCDEAATVLFLLQNTVKGLFSWLDNADPKALQTNSDTWRDYVLFGFANMNASNDRQVACSLRRTALDDDGEVWGAAPNLGSLTSAVSNQIIETVADEAEWYKCKAADCGRWFKRKRGKDSPRTNSEYCSQTCSERIRKQKQRKRTDTSTL